METGLTYTATLTVDNAHSAIAMGSGDMPVLATPAMVALMENAAMMAVAPHLSEGTTTVGGQISTSHLRPSSMDAVVTATATLEKAEGKKLFFRVEARQGETLIGEGTHLRFIVDRKKFMEKL
ncbi:MAG: thioesterase family protein [Prevotella sp.]